MSSNLYEDLGLRAEECPSPESIRTAYRRLALLTHPDRGGDIEEFNRVNLAYEILSDPPRRSRYDAGETDGLLPPHCAESGYTEEDAEDTFSRSFFFGFQSDIPQDQREIFDSCFSHRATQDYGGGDGSGEGEEDQRMRAIASCLRDENVESRRLAFEAVLGLASSSYAHTFLEDFDMMEGIVMGLEDQERDIQQTAAFAVALACKRGYVESLVEYNVLQPLFRLLKSSADPEIAQSLTTALTYLIEHETILAECLQLGLMDQVLHCLGSPSKHVVYNVVRIIFALTNIPIQRTKLVYKGCIGILVAVIAVHTDQAIQKTCCMALANLLSDTTGLQPKVFNITDTPTDRERLKKLLEVLSRDEARPYVLNIVEKLLTAPSFPGQRHLVELFTRGSPDVYKRVLDCARPTSSSQEHATSLICLLMRNEEALGRLLEAGVVDVFVQLFDTVRSGVLESVLQCLTALAGSDRFSCRLADNPTCLKHLSALCFRWGTPDVMDLPKWAVANIPSDPRRRLPPRALAHAARCIGVLAEDTSTIPKLLKAGAFQAVLCLSHLRDTTVERECSFAIKSLSADGHVAEKYQGLEGLAPRLSAFLQSPDVSTSTNAVIAIYQIACAGPSKKLISLLLNSRALSSLLDRVVVIWEKISADPRTLLSFAATLATTTAILSCFARTDPKTFSEKLRSEFAGGGGGVSDQPQPTKTVGGVVTAPGALTSTVTDSGAKAVIYLLRFALHFVKDDASVMGSALNVLTSAVAVIPDKLIRAGAVPCILDILADVSLPSLLRPTLDALRSLSNPQLPLHRTVLTALWQRKETAQLLFSSASHFPSDNNAAHCVAQIVSFGCGYSLLSPESILACVSANPQQQQSMDEVPPSGGSASGKKSKKQKAAAESEVAKLPQVQPPARDFAQRVVTAGGVQYLSSILKTIPASTTTPAAPTTNGSTAKSTASSDLNLNDLQCSVCESLLSTLVLAAESAAATNAQTNESQTQAESAAAKSTPTPPITTPAAATSSEKKKSEKRKGKQQSESSTQPTKESSSSGGGGGGGGSGAVAHQSTVAATVENALEGDISQTIARVVWMLAGGDSKARMRMIALMCCYSNQVCIQRHISKSSALSSLRQLIKSTPSPLPTNTTSAVSIETVLILKLTFTTLQNICVGQGSPDAFGFTEFPFSERYLDFLRTAKENAAVLPCILSSLALAAEASDSVRTCFVNSPSPLLEALVKLTASAQEASLAVLGCRILASLSSNESNRTRLVSARTIELLKPLDSRFSSHQEISKSKAVIVTNLRPPPQPTPLPPPPLTASQPISDGKGLEPTTASSSPDKKNSTESSTKREKTAFSSADGGAEFQSSRENRESFVADSGLDTSYFQDPEFLKQQIEIMAKIQAENSSSSSSKKKSGARILSLNSAQEKPAAADKDKSGTAQKALPPPPPPPLLKPAPVASTKQQTTKKATTTTKPHQPSPILTPSPPVTVSVAASDSASPPPPPLAHEPPPSSPPPVPPTPTPPMSPQQAPRPSTFLVQVATPPSTPNGKIPSVGEHPHPQQTPSLTSPIRAPASTLGPPLPRHSQIFTTPPGIGLSLSGITSGISANSQGSAHAFSPSTAQILLSYDDDSGEGGSQNGDGDINFEKMISVLTGSGPPERKMGTPPPPPPPTSQLTRSERVIGSPSKSALGNGVDGHQSSNMHGTSSLAFSLGAFQQPPPSVSSPPPPPPTTSSTDDLNLMMAEMSVQASPTKRQQQQPQQQSGAFGIGMLPSLSSSVIPLPTMPPTENGGIPQPPQIGVAQSTSPIFGPQQIPFSLTSRLTARTSAVGSGQAAPPFHGQHPLFSEASPSFVQPSLPPPPTTAVDSQSFSNRLFSNGGLLGSQDQGPMSRFSAQATTAQMSSAQQPKRKVLSAAAKEFVPSAPMAPPPPQQQQQPQPSFPMQAVPPPHVMQTSGQHMAMAMGSGFPPFPLSAPPPPPPQAQPSVAQGQNGQAIKQEMERIANEDASESARHAAFMQNISSQINECLRQMTASQHIPASFGYWERAYHTMVEQMKRKEAEENHRHAAALRELESLQSKAMSGMVQQAPPPQPHMVMGGYPPVHAVPQHYMAQQGYSPAMYQAMWSAAAAGMPMWPPMPPRGGNNNMDDVPK